MRSREEPKARESITHCLSSSHSDLVNTLLHEMIHAYNFVAERKRDRDDHGEMFRAWMNKLNKGEVQRKR